MKELKNYDLTDTEKALLESSQFRYYIESITTEISKKKETKGLVISFYRLYAVNKTTAELKDITYCLCRKFDGQYCTKYDAIQVSISGVDSSRIVVESVLSILKNGKEHNLIKFWDNAEITAR